MYRSYESPEALERHLAFLKAREDKLRQMLRNTESFSTMEELHEDIIEVHQQVEELEQRVNHAWQDRYEEDI